MLAPVLRAPDPPGRRDRRRAGRLGAVGFARAHPDRRADRAGRADRRLRPVLARALRRSAALATDLVIGAAPPERAGAASGDLGDRRGARRRARDRGARQHRRRRVPQPDRDPRRRAGRRGRGGARHAGRRGGGRRVAAGRAGRGPAARGRHGVHRGVPGRGADQRGGRRRRGGAGHAAAPPRAGDRRRLTR